ncbi:MAG: hypothetical protein OEZ68_13460 [Gammaproteobacteria bacterium]|nr:hypothetical protein [Gammaproteobacteria bacterium]MDH5801808.1 hypothetical protein [Gammaproteobacteria bacterium]
MNDMKERSAILAVVLLLLALGFMVMSVALPGSGNMSAESELVVYDGDLDAP